ILAGTYTVACAAADNAGTVVCRRHLADPRRHELLPRPHEPLIAGAPVRPGEIEAEIELAPLQAPLAIRRQRGAHPVRLDAEGQRRTLNGEPSRRRVFSSREIAVLLVDDAEHGSGRRRRANRHTACFPPTIDGVSLSVTSKTRP